jgi:hypothetical protein
MSEETPQQDSVQEQPQEQPAVEQQPQVDLSSNFAELRRKERELHSQQAKIKDTVEAEKNKFFEELKADPYTTLNKYGISTSQLGEQMLALPMEEIEEEQDSALQKEIEELKAWRKEREEAEIARRQEDEVNRYRKEVFSVVEQEADKFELINASDDGKKLYWDTVTAYAKLANKVEDHLYERAKKLLGTSKFKVSEEPKPEPKVEQPRSQSNTISNAMTGRHIPKVTSVNSKESVGISSKFDDFVRQQKQATFNKFFADKD